MAALCPECHMCLGCEHDARLETASALWCDHAHGREDGGVFVRLHEQSLEARYGCPSSFRFWVEPPPSTSTLASFERLMAQLRASSNPTSVFLALNGTRMRAEHPRRFHRRVSEFVDASNAKPSTPHTV